MNKEPVIHRKGFDWITLAVFISLVIVGWLMQYAVSYDKTLSYSFFDVSNPVGKTTVITIVAFILFFAGFVVEWKFWHTFSYLIYSFFILFLVLVLIFGSNVKGSQSWFNFMGFSLQPSEFAKFGTALAISSYIAFYKHNIVEVKILFRGFLLILLPVFLIMLQPDAGSALVFLSLTITLYRNGISIYYLLIPIGLLLTFVFALIYGVEMISLFVLLIAIMFLALVYYHKKYLSLGLTVLSIVLIFLYFLGFPNTAILISGISFLSLSLYYWFRNQKNSSLFILPTILILILFSFLTNYVFDNVLKSHQQDRINVWLRPEMSDPRGALYNIIQSKMAIGSGGLQGKGYLKGTMTNLNYVPEQSTDFIFSTVGEEQGFIGSISVIILYLLLILRVLMIGERSNNKFILSYAYSIGGFLFIHFFINIGMTMGLVPVIGIPLPFMSKGGSALLAFSLMLGVLMKLDVSRRIR
jgi:rod shape determining protein RodA